MSGLATKISEDINIEVVREKYMEEHAIGIFCFAEIEGTLAALKNGKWSIAKTFTTKSAADAYLDSLMTASGTAYTVTYNANGGTGSITAATVTSGQSVTLSDGTGLTAPSNKTFSGWATTSSATSADVTSPYTPTGDVTLYAVWSNAQ